MGRWGGLSVGCLVSGTGRVNPFSGSMVICDYVYEPSRVYEEPFSVDEHIAGACLHKSSATRDIFQSHRDHGLRLSAASVSRSIGGGNDSAVGDIRKPIDGDRQRHWCSAVVCRYFTIRAAACSPDRPRSGSSCLGGQTGSGG